ncbi:hypothetical protein M0R45_029103 [Rubus argutus]|uniref:Uncharacterized protein n=1 Tax=Rubus argutus TaxID=59490 RepID=A0AAW1W9S0_RUBAR
MSLFGSDSDDGKALLPFEFPFSGFGTFDVASDFSSPVESSETESDEEEYLTVLTRRMARSKLDDEFKLYDSVLASKNNSKPWVSSGSPQSPVCGWEWLWLRRTRLEPWKPERSVASGHMGSATCGCR